MSTPNLTPTSYLVLGLVAGIGPVTPYEMKQMVATSIGYFWSFPHSQLYAEPDRLAGAGLLAVDQEEGGRRRKRYSITDEGRQALLAWLGDPQTEQGETREPGLLKLFFAEMVDTEAVVALASTQARRYREQLEVYRAIEASIDGQPGFAFPLATLRLGMRIAEAERDFWDEIAADPPTAD